jgi:hypothetical protein
MTKATRLPPFPPRTLPPHFVQRRLPFGAHASKLGKHLFSVVIDTLALLKRRLGRRLQRNHGTQIHASSVATCAPAACRVHFAARFSRRSITPISFVSCEPDLAMLREILPIGRAAVLVASLVAVGAAVAGGSSPRDRQATNTFTLLTGNTAQQAPVVVRSNGTGIGPSKPVVSNPYQVPLLQNAGPIRALR